jgi:pullulanase/glycogen debranching enzyme
VKQCHRRGIRVIFDVVMNHARECPLAKLDFDSYYLHNPGEEPGRGDSYGADMFRYRTRGADGTFAAREFHYLWAEFLIREYHADGFRVDEFRGIDNWEFIQEFRDRAWKIHQAYFPGRPFIVIAEDSWRRTVITQDDGFNPNGRRVTDSMWNFSFRDEIRRCLRDELTTQWGEPSRGERIQWAISSTDTWDDLKKSGQPGFFDMSQAVNYLTSHDVEKENEKRIMNYLFGPLLRWYGRPDYLEHIRWIADNVDGPDVPEADRYAHGEALERVRSAFAILLTSVGIPMILAGDEFGDVHDLDNTNYRLKMSDPVDWSRRYKSANNKALWNNVRDLIELRKHHPALLRNEITFFYFHPSIDENRGEAVFAYSRTRGESLGRDDQVIVVANFGGTAYGEFHLPWPWRNRGRLREIAPPTYRAELELVGFDWAKLSIAPFQARVFAS